MGREKENFFLFGPRATPVPPCPNMPGFFFFSFRLLPCGDPGGHSLFANFSGLTMENQVADSNRHRHKEGTRFCSACLLFLEAVQDAW